MTSPSVVRVREVRWPPPGGQEDALRLFDSLLPGQSVVVLADRPPRELLTRLQSERRGTFEWSPLEDGPAMFRVELTRRSAGRGAMREVAEALAWDHDRLDAIEQRAFESLESGNGDEARAIWDEFAVGLRRHIRFEEEVLFPAFEERVGLSAEAGPTAVMRAEHRDIAALIEAIGRALASKGAPEALRAALHDLLAGHNVKEERVLYPATDRALSPPERDALVARIQAR